MNCNLTNPAGIIPKEFIDVFDEETASGWKVQSSDTGVVVLRSNVREVCATMAARLNAAPDGNLVDVLVGCLNALDQSEQQLRRCGAFPLATMVRRNADRARKALALLT